jgi:hypothetical protein
MNWLITLYQMLMDQTVSSSEGQGMSVWLAGWMMVSRL